MESKSGHTKLYRSNEERVFAGVCGGIAEYFDIDPVIVRLIWIIFVIYGGSGIVLYLLAWILIPRHPIELG